MNTFQFLTEEQIASMRDAGSILRDCLAEVPKHVAPGVTTKELDLIAEAFIRDHGGEPAFKGYNGFTGTLCTSVNEEVVHGIPGSRILADGDIISLDCGVKMKGMYTDACVTVPVGNVKKDVLHFLDTTSAILEAVVQNVVAAGVFTGDISAFIQEHLESAGYKPVPQLTGHGLGTTLHVYPDIPNIGKPGTGAELPAGIAIAIEPIAVMGSPVITQEDDGWTIVTKDKSLSCHFEHTILVEEGGIEVLA